MAGKCVIMGDINVEQKATIKCQEITFGNPISAWRKVTVNAPRDDKACSVLGTWPPSPYVKPHKRLADCPDLRVRCKTKPKNCWESKNERPEGQGEFYISFKEYNWKGTTTLLFIRTTLEVCEMMELVKKKKALQNWSGLRLHRRIYICQYHDEKGDGLDWMEADSWGPIV